MYRSIQKHLFIVHMGRYPGSGDVTLEIDAFVKLM